LHNNKLKFGLIIPRYIVGEELELDLNLNRVDVPGLLALFELAQGEGLKHLGSRHQDHQLKLKSMYFLQTQDYCRIVNVLTLKSWLLDTVA
jgi:hypothetical protein